MVKATYLKDYRPPAYNIEHVKLNFELFEDRAIVTANLDIKQLYRAPLTLQGEELELLSLRLNGEELPTTYYQVTDTELTLKDLPQNCSLQTQVRIYPQNNKTLEGLYKSGSIFCTQCEAHGFRRITYFLDRPDVMSKYQVRIEGDKNLYPFLLAGGNPIERGDLPNGRHFVIWQDPFKKPCYLFALVAGDLGVVRDQYVTHSGNTVALEIYCDHGNEHRCLHAMESLKNAMRWDEEKFGLEYDLDIYMIVAVDSFNMGAMENKGLNIFNSSCVLADPASATDSDYQNIEGIIGHEYFHNWTGNRVTCRDWFQLTLKEGLTVYRDQEFSSDMQSRTVERIKAIRILKIHQFPEDAGPLAHPVLPQSYIKMDNFYTSTVYNKGAEVIRMVEGLIGKDNFRKGMDKYFELYDGQAVTTEDFIHAMELASGQDLSQFQQTWYNQAGTPLIEVQMSSTGNGEIELKITQSTPSHKRNLPFVMPFPVALYTEQGELLERKTLILSQAKENFRFSHPSKAGDIIPSLNLGFASPVKVKYDYSEQDLMSLMKFDQDQYNRYQASQQLAMLELLKVKDQIKEGKQISFNPQYLSCYGHLLQDKTIDPELKALTLKLPSFTEIIEQQGRDIDFEASEKARLTLYRHLAQHFDRELQALLARSQGQDHDEFSLKAIGERALINTALAILAERTEDESMAQLISGHYDRASHMTDQMAALQAIVHHAHPERERVVQDFYQRWKQDSTVYSYWLSVVAGGRAPGTIKYLQNLMDTPPFDITVPNHVRAVIQGMTGNPLLFHQEGGEGYALAIQFAQKYDAINPQVCARMLATLFRPYPAMAGSRKAMVGKLLQELKAIENLSQNTYEIVDKILENGDREQKV